VSDTRTTDVVIVGAGPIGLELAVALKRAGIDYVHLEAKQVGDTMWHWAPRTRFFSSNERIAIAGVPLSTLDQSKATREEYLKYLRDVVSIFDLKVNTYEPVADVRPQAGGGFVVMTRPLRGEQTYRAKRVVLVTGGTARARKIDVPGEDLPHVTHWLPDPALYFRTRVLVVGGRNSAVEAALRCYAEGAEVSVSYRQAGFDEKSIKYWLLPEIKGLIGAGKIKAYFNTCVSRIEADRAVLIGSGPGGQGGETVVPGDFVLLMTGYVADMALCRAAGVRLSDPCEVPALNEATMETNVPGLYLAGTAVGGTQERYRLFIENCHVHVDRILAALTGQAPPTTAPRPEVVQMPES